MDPDAADIMALGLDLAASALAIVVVELTAPPGGSRGDRRSRVRAVGDARDGL